MISKTKEELLNDIIGSTKRTGQGLPKFVIDRGGWNDIADELVEDGYIDIHEHEKGDPVKTWYCYNKVYNVEKDGYTFKGTMLYYSFMRNYMRFSEDDDKGILPKDSEVVQANMDKYKVWLTKNVEGLEAIKSLQEVTINTELSDDVKEYLKSRSWYIDNLLVDESIIQLKKGTRDTEEIISISEKILSLIGNEEHYNSKKEQYTKEIEDSKLELKYRSKIFSIMSKADSSINVQDAFKEYLS